MIRMDLSKASLRSTTLKASDGRQYATIVRAQLSTAGLILLFANAQTSAVAPFTKFFRRLD